MMVLDGTFNKKYEGGLLVKLYNNKKIVLVCTRENGLTVRNMSSYISLHFFLNFMERF